MAYRICYPSINERKHQKYLHVRFYLLTGLFLTIFGITTFHFWPEGRIVLESVLIPGDPDVTVPAFHTLLHSLSTGESTADSIRTFCTCVLEGANIAAH